ncbi:NADPH:quinone oxidoreductase family protein [Phytomonospora endophytica]|uniref:NADPH2:quinone reductase n=1 Tax=Phytomonospora endophytica TaxID=714109 RepID=A0A841FP82_9ACTN|nr:NADPH:quinone oxidoreductase family protein [Phytomonospora endophytica]MBB6035598.1 NADPH2:quinone reductase [Phytomonospora endophytica]GIG70040.1 oxidoreductase [Phytomonospora endophytica]
MAETMRAWHVTAHGEPERVMALGEVDVPEPAPGEVLLRVRTVAVNFPDVLLARGEYQERPELPFIPGVELCGDVAALGEGVTGLAVGQRVVGSKIGVLAEYATVPAVAVRPAPEPLDDPAAAALTVAYQTAWFGLHRRAAIRPGETLLVHAAAGGVGTAACQLGAAAGATVIGVVGGPAKAEVAKAAGAHEVHLRGDDWAGAVKRAHRSVDVVFDPVGGAAFEGSVRCLAFEGRVIVVGFAGGVVPTVRADHALVKNYSVLGLHWGLYQLRRPDLVDEAHAELTRLAAEGVVRPVIDDVVPFEDAPAAVQRLAGGTTTGRLVVRVAT